MRNNSSTIQVCYGFLQPDGKPEWFARLKLLKIIQIGSSCFCVAILYLVLTLAKVSLTFFPLSEWK